MAEMHWLSGPGPDPTGEATPPTPEDPIAAEDRGVWVPGVTLDLVDRATGAITASLPIPSYAVALDGGTLWVLDVFGRLVRHAVPK